MKIEEINHNLGKLVHYTDEFRLLDHDFRFNACTKRATVNGVVYEAELQSPTAKGSVIIVPLEKVQVIA